MGVSILLESFHLLTFVELLSDALFLRVLELGQESALTLEVLCSCVCGCHFEGESFTAQVLLRFRRREALARVVSPCHVYLILSRP